MSPRIGIGGWEGCVCCRACSPGGPCAPATARARGCVCDARPHPRVCFNQALEDAEAAIGLRPEWEKGYFRKASALEVVDRLAEVR